MIIPCIFGTTKGLEVLYLSQTSLVNLDDAWIGVSASQVKLDEHSDCFRMYRREVGNQVLTWIGVYREVKEIGYNRAGGFYGAGVWLIDVAIDINIAAQTLIKLADQVKKLAHNNGQFVRTISDIKNSLQLPSETAALLGSAGPLSSGLSVSANSTAFFAAPTQCLAILDWAQSNSAAAFFDAVFVGEMDQFVSTQSKFGKTKQFLSLNAATDFVVANLNGALAKFSKENRGLREQVGILSGEKETLEANLQKVKADLSVFEQARKIAEQRRQAHRDADVIKPKEGNVADSLWTAPDFDLGLLLIALFSLNVLLNLENGRGPIWNFEVSLLIALTFGTAYLALRFFLDNRYEPRYFATTLVLFAGLSVGFGGFLYFDDLKSSLMDKYAETCDDEETKLSAGIAKCGNNGTTPQLKVQQPEPLQKQAPIEPPGVSAKPPDPEPRCGTGKSNPKAATGPIGQDIPKTSTACTPEIATQQSPSVPSLPPELPPPLQSNHDQNADISTHPMTTPKPSPTKPSH